MERVELAASPFTVRVLATCAAVACLLPACVNATFTKTADDFQEHSVEDLPEVYVDRLPSRAYDPVGIIEVVAPKNASLQQVFDAAAKKGQDVGCDVVVDRSIHRVGVLPPRRWTAVLAPEPPLQPLAALSSARTAPYFGVVATSPAPAPAAPLIQNPPPDKREFVCGIFRPSQQVVAGSAPAAGLSPPAGPEHIGLGDPPAGAGGFNFQAPLDEVRHACEQAGHTYSPGTQGVDRCDGVAASIGAAAQADLAYCTGKLCTVSLRVDLDGATPVGPALMRWKALLVARYGDPTQSKADIPTACSTDVSPCLADGTGHIIMTWRWPSHQSIALANERDADGHSRVRITYGVQGATTTPGL